MDCCPACGRLITKAPDDLVRLIETIDMPRREYQTALALLDMWPRLATGEYLVERLYRDEEIDVHTALENAIWSHLSKLRKKLQPHGWSIHGKRFEGWRFLAQPVDGRRELRSAALGMER